MVEYMFCSLQGHISDISILQGHFEQLIR